MCGMSVYICLCVLKALNIYVIYENDVRSTVRVFKVNNQESSRRNREKRPRGESVNLLTSFKSGGSSWA